MGVVSSRLRSFTMIVVPVASYVATEVVFTTGGQGTDPPYTTRLAGLVGLSQMALGIVVAAAAAALLGRGGRREASRSQACASAAIAALLAAFFMFGNGFPPAFNVGAQSRVVVVAAALALGLVAAAIERFAPGGGSFPAFSLVLPPAVVGAYRAELATGLLPASAAGIGILAVALAAACLVSRLAGRALERRARGATFAMTSLGVAAPLCAILLGRSPYPPVPPRAQGAPDVLLFVLDTVRADAAPARPGSALPTPAIERLAREGRQYTNAFSTSCWTAPAHASLFTGLPALRHGTGWEMPSLAEDLPTIAERFRSAGYRTAGFSANAWITPELGFARGFDVFRVAAIEYEPLRPWPVRFFPGLFSRAESFAAYRDKGGLSVASEALRFLAADAGRPAFVFVNLFEAHLPYLPPRDVFESLARDGWSRRELRAVDMTPYRDLQANGERTPREKEGLRRLYEGEVAYNDQILGRVLSRLERAGRLDGTIVAILGDHGENLGDHVPLDHQLGLYDTLVRIPLILRYPPKISAGARDDRFASIEDVPDALARLAGLPAPASEANLLDGPGRDAVFFVYDRPGHVLDLLKSRYGIDPSPYDRQLFGARGRDAKWVEGSDGRNEAYDIVADPGERMNLAAGAVPLPASFVALTSQLDEYRRENSPSGKKEAAPIPPDVLDRLRVLGYVP